MMSFIVTILIVVTTTVIMVVTVDAFRTAFTSSTIHHCRRPSSSWVMARSIDDVSVENALGKNNDKSSTVQIKRNNISMVIQSQLDEGRLNDAVSELLSWKRRRRRCDDDDDDDDDEEDE